MTTTADSALSTDQSALSRRMLLLVALAALAFKPQSKAIPLTQVR